MIRGLFIRLMAVISMVPIKEFSYKKRRYDDVVKSNYHIRNHEQRLVTDVIEKYCGKEYSILELGCGAGRNLECLRINGYHQLHGIDVSNAALAVAKFYFPKLAEISTLRVGYAQKILRNYQDNYFDVVFSVAVLQHIMHGTENLFKNIARIAKKYIITIERDLYEQQKKDRDLRLNPKECIVRDYGEIFSNLGFEEVEVFGCWEVPLELHSIAEHYDQQELFMLEEIRDFIGKFDRSPTANEVDRSFQNNVDVYEYKFGSFLFALEASGIEKPYSGMEYTIRVLKKK